MRFTPYIKAMQAEDYPTELLKAVENALEQAMKKKRLWTAPPAILGYSDCDNWEKTGNFQTLAFDCFIYAITNRLQHLHNALKAGSDNIDGLVMNNIDNFLLDLQKKYDTTGYYLARNAQITIEKLLNDKQIKAEPLSKKNTVYNHTVLFFPPFEIKQPNTEAQLETNLKKLVNWDRDLPILKKQQINPDTQIKMTEIILKLGEAVFCFRFRSFMQVFKAGAWQASRPEFISISPTENDEDDQQDIEALLPPVPDISIDWSLLQSFAHYVSKKCKTNEEKQIWYAIIEYFAQEQDMPTVRTIANQTDIPKSTVGDVMKKIRAYVDDYCSDKM